MKKISIITLNIPGLDPAGKIVGDLLTLYPSVEIDFYYKKGVIPNIPTFNAIKFKNIDDILHTAWNTSDAIIWFAATGIVVRKIASLLVSKTQDPANLVINLSRTQVIPLLSGHIGGANELADDLCYINNDMVSFVTTATDSTQTFAFDMFAKKYGLTIVNIHKLAEISNNLINRKKISLITYEAVFNMLLKEGLKKEQCEFINVEYFKNSIKPAYPAVPISACPNKIENDMLKLNIDTISLGIGLRKGVSTKEMIENFYDFLEQTLIPKASIKTIASFDAKKNEKALLDLCEELIIQPKFYAKQDINRRQEDFSKSRATDFFDIKGVAEPCAILGARNCILFIEKISYSKTTIAAAF